MVAVVVQAVEPQAKHACYLPSHSCNATSEVLQLVGLLEVPVKVLACSYKDRPTTCAGGLPRAYHLDEARALGCVDRTRVVVGKLVRFASLGATLAQCNNLRFLELGFHGGMPVAKECVALAGLAFALHP
jgi:hypothetical protein